MAYSYLGNSWSWAGGWGGWNGWSAWRGWSNYGYRNNNSSLSVGADQVGSGGNDWISATATTLNIGDMLVGGSGVDTVTLNGAGVFDFTALAHFSGFEKVQTSQAEQTVRLGDGQTLGLDLGSGQHRVEIGNSNVVVIAQQGNQQIHSGAGYVAIYANSGVLDITTGTGGSDITLGRANVTVSLGEGRDVLRLAYGDSVTQVQGFVSGVDKIDLRALGWGYSDWFTAVNVSNANGNTTLNAPSGAQLTLLGVATLSDIDVMF